jgi:hypothetical protein
MATITIPKTLTGDRELVIIQREEYDFLRQMPRVAKEFIPTAAEKRALARMRAERKRGVQFLSISELRAQLGIRN